jgi:hypothetical protein
MKNKTLKKILFLGDSHCVMTMGQVIVEKINENYENADSQLYFYAVSGASFLDWFQAKQNIFQIRNSQKIPGKAIEISTNPISIDFLKELETLHPEILILALGTNDLIIHQDDLDNYLTSLDRGLKQIAQKYKKLSIIWIMPPEFIETVVMPSSRRKLGQVLQNNNKIQLVDILGFFPDQQDQIHFNKSKATQFAIKIFEKLKIILSS